MAADKPLLPARVCDVDEANTVERQFAGAGQPLAQPGRLQRQRKCDQLAVMDVFLEREEQVTSACVLPAAQERVVGEERLAVI